MYYAFIDSFLHFECYNGYLQQKNAFAFASALLRLRFAAPHRHRQGAHGAVEPVNGGATPFFPRLPFGEILRVSDGLPPILMKMASDGQLASLGRVTSVANCGRATPSEEASAAAMDDHGDTDWQRRMDKSRQRLTAPSSPLHAARSTAPPRVPTRVERRRELPLASRASPRAPSAQPQSRTKIPAGERQPR
jgi:hypothetical protein